MLKKSIIVSVLILVVFTLVGVTACSNQSAAASGGNLNATIKQTRIKVQLIGDTVTIPVSDLEKYGNINFKVNSATDSMSFMAYQLGGQTYVRADVCVPCGSDSFTLNKGKLVCDACSTVFDAQTGKGVSGVKACQSFTKLPVNFQVTDGNIVMKGSDLATAFQNTINRKY